MEMGIKIVLSWSIQTYHMDKNRLFKYLPYLAAVVIFTVLACVYCAPVFQGKELYAGDNMHYRGAVHEAVQYHEETGNYTWWTGSMFSGMPSYQIGGGHYKSESLLKPLRKIFNPSHSSRLPMVFILYFCCFYILMRSVGVDRWLSIVGALAIGFSSYLYIIEPAGHQTKSWTIALMSAVVAGFLFVFRKQYKLGACLTMFFTAMGYSKHPQMTYYMFMLIGVLFIAQLYVHIREKRYKELLLAFSIFAGSLLIGVGTGSSYIFANREYVKETMRGGHSDLGTDNEGDASKGLSMEYMTNWSYGIDESLTFLIPGVKGNASGYDVGTESNTYKDLVSKGIPKSTAKSISQSIPLYWGPQPMTAGPVYAGALVCFLFVLGLIIVKGPYKWALLVATCFSFALAWGNNFMWLTRIFYNWFPMYSQFRNHTQILVVAEITVPLLGLMGIKAVMDGSVSREKLNRAIYTAAGITGGICLFMILFGGAIYSFSSLRDAGVAASFNRYGIPLSMDSIMADRHAALTADSLRSLLFILLSAGTVWLFANNKLKKAWLIAILGVLVVADMWPIDKRFFNESNFVSPRQLKDRFAMKPYEKAILADTDLSFRVMNLTEDTFNESRTSYYLKSIGGYSAAKLRRYQDIIDVYLSEMNLDVISMLNGKYIITADKEGNATPMRNPGALGNAWYVPSLTLVDSPAEECRALGNVDLSTTIVVGDDYKQYVADFTPAAKESRIELTSYAPDVLTYRSDSPSDGTVVFSEIFYPYGWNAYIDGKPADIFRANYLLRAMNIPAGQHEIRMEFRPDSVELGDRIASFCVSIMYAFILGSIAGTLVVRGRRRKSA